MPAAATEGNSRSEAAAGAARRIAEIAAEPRPSGGSAERAARDRCATALVGAGFDVDLVPFSYSAFPGRWGTPVCGAVAVTGLLVAAHLSFRGAAALAIAVLAVTLAFLASFGFWLARVGVLNAPLLRSQGVNLVARRGGAGEPGDGAHAVWLVAHLDSKSQPVPILARAIAISLLGLMWVGAVAMAVVQSLGADIADLWPWFAGAVVLVGAPVVASVAGARSPGALDNATGVAAVMLAAEQAPRETPAAVLLTSAEELGLAGARAWARESGIQPGTAVNVDTLGDSGVLRIVVSGRAPRELIARLRAAARRAAVPLREIRLLPGVLVDGVALSDAGWEVVTLSRGTLATLARVHTVRDTPDRLIGSGVADAAAVLVELLRGRRA
ncbi:MAG: M28 family peptidase [Gemmatimonadaceae bacterium]